jgi:hypothetical protein
MLSRSGFYDWQKCEPLVREVADTDSSEVIGTIHDDSRATYKPCARAVHISHRALGPISHFLTHPHACIYYTA